MMTLCLGASVWMLYKLLSLEDSVSRSLPGLNRPRIVILTSKTLPECVVDCLAQHGVKNITSNLDLSHCNSRPFVRGGFGAIYQGVLQNGQLVAIKSIESFSNCETSEHSKNLKRAAREIYTWSRCKHQGVLPVLGFVRFQGQVALVTPWMNAGTLRQQIVRGSLPTPLRTCVELAGVVEYLHTNGVIHGDIKPDNVLMTDQGQVQLADFGSALLTVTTTLSFTQTKALNFTPRFTAPEILKEECRAFTEESDIYALGMTIFNIMTGKPPFADKHDLTVIVEVMVMGRQLSRPDFGNTLRGDVAKRGMWDLLKRCVSYAPEDRPKAVDVKKILAELGMSNDAFGGDVGVRADGGE